MNNPLAKDFSLKELLMYTLPSIMMMLFMSTYTVVDGIFVSNLVGEDALAAVNLVFPIFGIAMAIGLMFATGGNAIIANLMGQGKDEEARSFLTVIYIIGGALGLISTALIYMFPDQLLGFLGVSDVLYPFAKDYLLSFTPFLTPLFYLVFVQTFLVTAGKPALGFGVCILGGVANIVLDYVLISPQMLDMGITGAGLATGIGYTIPGIFGLVYFAFYRKGNLYFVKPVFHLKRLLQSMYNGMSELVGSLSSSITMIMFNYILMAIAGESGIAAISVIMYLMQFQTAIYIGFSMGISPIISFKYGENNRESLKKVVKQGLIIIAGASALIIVGTLFLSEQAVSIFIEQGSSTFAMAEEGLLLFTISYLFMGFNVLFSALFTALSNGRISATLSVLRSLVFIIIMLLILPHILGITGVWLAIPVAEFLAIIIGIFFFRKYRTQYGY